MYLSTYTCALSVEVRDDIYIYVFSYYNAGIVWYVYIYVCIQNIVCEGFFWSFLWLGMYLGVLAEGKGGQSQCLSSFHH